MEPHNIDPIIKAIKDSESFYDTEANKAKERIWKHVQFQRQSYSRPILFRSLVAACVLLFISTSLVTVSYIRSKESIKALVKLNGTLRSHTTANDQNSLLLKETLIAAGKPAPDTVYIEKKIVATQPVRTAKQIIDTVYIRQIVYVPKEQNQELSATIDNNNLSDSISQVVTKNYETDIFIRNNESVKREKKKKFQIKFGGNKNRINSGTLALTTEF